MSDDLTADMLADDLGVSGPAVRDWLRLLAQQKILHHAPHQRWGFSGTEYRLLRALYQATH